MAKYAFLLLSFLAVTASLRGDDGAGVDMATAPDATLGFYATHGPITDPGEYAYMCGSLPRDVAALRDVVQGVLVHVFHARRYGVQLPEERQSEVGLRKVEDMLARIAELDGRPVTERREPDKRLVANCRGYAVLLCSLLRQAGIPARARCGFETYFTPGTYSDHWICEYWNEEENRWVRVDPQVDDVQREDFGLVLEPLDLPEGSFVPAGGVWLSIRAGEVDPGTCGFEDLKGTWFVKDNVLRDLMALNKVEVMPWDCNEFMGSREAPDEGVCEIIDNVARATESASAEVFTLYASDARFRMAAAWEP